jgi:Metallo-beta-lactamase superfamily
MTTAARLRTAPRPTELEISLFGPGVGECVVVHLGGNEWMVVDSCLDSRTRAPAALNYLRALEVPIETQLRAVVVTHWHRDHFQGAAALLEAARGATFWCSNALQSKEFFQFIFRWEEDRARSGLQIEEFAEVLRILRARSPDSHPSTIGPEWAIADRPLLSRPASPDLPLVQVVALSPSSATVSAARTNIKEFIPEGTRDRRPIATTGNRLAVALWIQFGTASALLGADLEDSGQSNMGWQAILAANAGRYVQGAVFKVPHHGSSTAHNPNIWTAMLKGGPHSVLTANLASALPTDGDVRRLKALTPNLFCTMNPRGQRPRRRDPTVERLMGPYNVRAASGTGHIRLRFEATTTSQPRVELFNTAQPL